MNTTPLSPEHTALLQSLVQYITKLGPIAVAYSGGLDSRSLVYLAAKSGLDVLALHAAGPHISKKESQEAAEWAQQHGISYRVVYCNPLENLQVAQNQRDRCYHCKTMLMKSLLHHAQGRSLCDGTNASDLGEYRPGLTALRELGVISPFAANGVDKTTLRVLAGACGMDRPDQCARPCLLTRFQYNYPIEPQQLLAVDAAEEAVSQALQHWQHHSSQIAQPMPDFRLRGLKPGCYELHLALHEIPEQLESMLKQCLSSAGFHKIPLRCYTQLSGFFDRQ